jgi:hypothetical protein
MRGSENNRSLFSRYGTSALLGFVALGCAQPRQQPPAPIPTPLVIAELPPMPVETIAVDSLPAPAPKGGRITLTSINADLRDLLPLLASAAGVNLVMGPEVRGRVSVRFQNVAAIDALKAVIEQAGLLVGEPGPEAPWSRPAFYDLPVNINHASATTIRARFELTSQLANWIVASRTF